MTRRSVITFLFCLLLPLWAAGQPSLKSLEMKVFIQDNGDAVVTETRTMTITSKGTECYIPMEGLRDITLSNFKVSDETGLNYALVGWDVSATRRQKAGRCGIISKGEGAYELCWGLDELKDGESQKDKVYTITYTLGSLMKSYYEAEGFNHLFIAPGISPLPDSVRVSVAVEGTPIDTSNARGWAFGYYGETGFLGDSFEAWTGKFTSASRVIIMLALKKDIIHPADTLDKAFQDVVDKALESASFPGEGYGGSYEESEPLWMDVWAEKICRKFGSSDEKNINRVSNAITFSVLGLVAAFLLMLKKMLGLLVYIVSLEPLWTFLKRMKVKSIVNKSLSKWQREIPFNGSLYAANKALNSLSYRQNPSINNVLGAFILRLFQRGELTLTYDNGKQTIKVGEHVDQTANLEDDGKDRKSPKDIKMENTLYYIFKCASGEDRILQENELKRWLKSNTKYAREILDLQSSPISVNKEELARLEKLKNFLRDFTLIQERGVMEVKLWDEYLVFASLFGIADQVRKEFRKVCPEYFSMSKFAQVLDSQSFDFSTTVYTIANYTSNAAVYSTLAAERSAAYSSMWSGGGGGSYGGRGGHSSYSGGGGYSGGGSGGGIR